LFPTRQGHQSSPRQYHSVITKRRYGMVPVISASAKDNPFLFQFQLCPSWNSQERKHPACLFPPNPASARMRLRVVYSYKKEQLFRSVQHLLLSSLSSSNRQNVFAAKSRAIPNSSVAVNKGNNPVSYRETSREKRTTTT